MSEGVDLQWLSRPAARTADLVFIHGLNGNLIRTWATRLNDGTLGDPWPSLFEKIHPDLGILTVGYPAPATRDPKRPHDNITNIATAVLEALLQHDVGRRPLIVVAYSLGGLVLKEILVQASLVGPDDPRAGISQNIKGAFFIATPHDGAALARMATMAVPTAVSSFLQALSANGEHVMSLKRKYNEIAKTRTIETWSLVEQRPVEVLNLLGLRVYETIVPEPSATAGYGDVKLLDSDHVEISRIKTERDPLFVFLADRLDVRMKEFRVKHLPSHAGKAVGRLTPEQALDQAMQKALQDGDVYEVKDN